MDRRNIWGGGDYSLCRCYVAMMVSWVTMIRKSEKKSLKGKKNKKHKWENQNHKTPPKKSKLSMRNHKQSNKTKLKERKLFTEKQLWCKWGCCCYIFYCVKVTFSLWSGFAFTWIHWVLLDSIPVLTKLGLLDSVIHWWSDWHIVVSKYVAWFYDSRWFPIFPNQTCKGKQRLWRLKYVLISQIIDFSHQHPHLQLVDSFLSFFWFFFFSPFAYTFGFSLEVLICHLWSWFLIHGSFLFWLSEFCVCVLRGKDIWANRTTFNGLFKGWVLLLGLGLELG